MKRSRKAAYTGTLIFATVVLGLTSCAQNVKITAPRYALAIGAQNYLYANSLSYTIADANSMSSLLTQKGWGSVSTLVDPDSTRQGIVDAISSLAAKVESDSTVLIYFSGHGGLLEDGTTAVICPIDANFLTNSSIIDPSTVISAAQLQSMLAELPTKNVIVILDSCYSGGFVPTGGAIDSSPSNYADMPSYSAFSTALDNFGNLLSANASASGNKTPVVLSAAGSDESSYDGSASQGHGVFTYFLLQAATNGDANGDGVVTTTEAYEYTISNLMAWDNEIPQMYQYIPQDEWPLPFLPHLSGGVRDLVLFGS